MHVLHMVPVILNSETTITSTLKCTFQIRLIVLMFLLTKFLHKIIIPSYNCGMEEFMKKFTYLLIFIFICSFCVPVFGTDSIYVWSDASMPEAVSTSTAVQSKEGNFLNLTCGSAILMEQSNGTILYEHNIHEQLRPASVTKVMTILLIMEAIDNGTLSLDDKVSCSEEASKMGGSQIWLDTTETLTVNEMLKAICVVSANDCCVAMAEHIAGSQELFVEKMNARAKELGMNDTCFKNCHGLDEDGHVTSSHDIAIMSRELMINHPSITNYTTIWMDSLRDGQSQLVNTNKLLRNYEGCTGLKTGSTSTALFNLSATATRNGLSLIAVVMRGETSSIRFAEAKKLLDYGFSNFEFVKYGSKGELVKNIPVTKGIQTSVEIVFENDSGGLIPKGQSSNITTTVSLPETINAPISIGDKVRRSTL